MHIRFALSLSLAGTHEVSEVQTETQGHTRHLVILQHSDIQAYKPAFTCLSPPLSTLLLLLLSPAYSRQYTAPLQPQPVLGLGALQPGGGGRVAAVACIGSGHQQAAAVAQQQRRHQLPQQPFGQHQLGGGGGATARSRDRGGGRNARSGSGRLCTCTALAAAVFSPAWLLRRRCGMSCSGTIVGVGGPCLAGAASFLAPHLCSSQQSPPSPHNAQEYQPQTPRISKSKM